MDEEIIALAEQGKSVNVISDLLNTSIFAVRKVLEKLKVTDNVKYNCILMEQSLAKGTIIDKDLLDDVVMLLSRGYSLLEIAIMKNVKVYDLKKLLKELNNKYCLYYDPGKYLLAQKIINRPIDINIVLDHVDFLKKKYPNVNVEEFCESKLLQDYYFRVKYMNFVRDFLDSFHLNLTIKDYALRNDISSAAISRISTCTDRYHVLDNNLAYLKDEFLSLWNKRDNKTTISYSTKVNYAWKDKTNFWLHFLFTTKISIYELSLLIKDTEDAVLNGMLFEAKKHGFVYVNALKYLMTSVSRESGNFNYAMILYADYKRSKVKNKARACNILREIFDIDYQALVKKKISIGSMNEKEKLLVANFRRKYAIPYYQMPFNNDSLICLCNHYLGEENEKISKFNSQNGYIYTRRRI